MFGISLLGGSGSNIFYDSLIVDVSDEKKRNIVSGFGYGLGYLGGGILFVFNVLFYLYPAWFGFENEVQAILVSFLTVSIWWFVFTVPLFLNVQEQKPSTKTKRLIRNSVKELINTISNISKYKNSSLLCPNEREARLAMQNKEVSLEKLSRDLIEKTNSEKLIMKLGPEGCVAYDRDDNEKLFSQSFHLRKIYLEANP